jgi:hypothetical protein
MPINISIKSPYVSGLNVYTAITTAFAGATYPIKVMVSNLSNSGDVFPLVGGIIETDHDVQQNNFIRAKKLELSSATDMQRLAANIERLSKQSTEPDVQYVIQEIGAGSAVNANSQPYKTGKDWYGDTFTGISDPYLPDAVAYGVGMLWLDGDLYWCDGSAYAAAGGGSSSATVQVIGARSAALADDGQILKNSTASNYAITIDADMAADFGFAYQQVSTGLASVVAGAGVTFVGTTLTTANPGDMLIITQMAVNKYAIYISRVG